LVDEGFQPVLQGSQRDCGVEGAQDRLRLRVVRVTADYILDGGQLIAGDLPGQTGSFLRVKFTRNYPFDTRNYQALCATCRRGRC
jgi:hypothetical protein